jgi:hypothetical protein
MLRGGNCTPAGALIVVVPAAMAAGYSWFSDHGTATAQISPFWRGIALRSYDKIVGQNGIVRLAVPVIAGDVSRRPRCQSGMIEKPTMTATETTTCPSADPAAWSSSWSVSATDETVLAAHVLTGGRSTAMCGVQASVYASFREWSYSNVRHRSS